MASQSAFEALVGLAPSAQSNLAIALRYRDDPSTQKVNLSVGAFRTEEEKPLVLECVKEAERRVLADPQANKEYLSYGGDPRFCKLAAELALGPGAAALSDGRAVHVQSLSGTGALRVAGEFLAQFYPHSKTILVSSPTWVNHRPIFTRCGLQVAHYRYFDAASRSLDYAGMLQDLEGAPEGAILLLQACAHNPTGVDPTLEQWAGVLEAAKRRRLFVLWDMAYQGFVTDVETDGAAVRMFAESGLEMMIAQSFSKTMGLYGERVGCLTLLAANPAAAKGAEEELHETVRSMYICPPKHGGAIATAILSDPQLRQQWQEELSGLAGTMLARRQRLRAALEAAGAPGDWAFLTEQRGMFSFTGLTRAQCEHLTGKWRVYLPPDGRFSFGAALLSKSEYAAAAIKDALERCPAGQ